MSALQPGNALVGTVFGPGVLMIHDCDFGNVYFGKIM